MNTITETMEQKKQQQAIEERMTLIEHTILVLSGKGGVGKSTVAVNCAAEIARDGKRVGLLDVDIHGPSIPGMLGIGSAQIFVNGTSMIPIEFTTNLTVMSIGFLLRTSGDAVIWRGPMKHGVIRQFIADVEWGKLDYLVVDCPPGTGDEPLSVAQMIGKRAGAVVVTTPQRVSIEDVRKSIQFCRKLDLKVIGIIENMSGFVCPHCGETFHIFDQGGGKSLAVETDTHFLGSIPIEPEMVKACDQGEPFVLKNAESETAQSFRNIVRNIMASCEGVV